METEVKERKVHDGNFSHGRDDFFYNPEDSSWCFMGR